MSRMIFQSVKFEEGENGQVLRYVRSVSMGEKFGVNAPCKCGSGKKYKKCHGNRARLDEIARQAKAAPIADSVINIDGVEDMQRQIDENDRKRRKELSTQPRVMAAALLGLVAASTMGK